MSPFGTKQYPRRKRKSIFKVSGPERLTSSNAKENVVDNVDKTADIADLQCKTKDVAEASTVASLSAQDGVGLILPEQHLAQTQEVLCGAKDHLECKKLLCKLVSDGTKVINRNLQTYNCTDCGKVFRRSGDYQRHLLIHSGEERPFKCSHCPFSAWRKHTLVTHLKIHSKEMNYSCDICGKRFVRKWAVKQHKMYHLPEGDRPFKCEVCGKGFARDFDLRSHRATAHPDPSTMCQCKVCHKVFPCIESRGTHVCPGKAFQCQICEKYFGRASSLKEHSYLHKLEKPHKCTQCPKSFSRFKLLAEHAFTHSGETPFQCDFCHEAYSLKSSLSSHVRQVHGRKPYRCEPCGEDLVSKFALQQHKKHHSPHNACLAFKCRECASEFPMVESLNAHFQLCHGGHKYGCGVCGKHLSSKRGLENHKHIHTGDLPCRCRVCGRRFPTPSDLSHHSMVHKGDRPYVCGICGRQFFNSSSLRKHVRVHTGEKPYVCHVCGKAFTQSANLSIHRRIHSQEKEFKCELCGKDFAQRANLRVHMVTHSGERPYKCSLCEKQFPLKSRLDSHIRVHFSRKGFNGLPSMNLSIGELEMQQLLEPVDGQFCCLRRCSTSELATDVEATLSCSAMLFSEPESMTRGTLPAGSFRAEAMLQGIQSERPLIHMDKSRGLSDDEEHSLLISVEENHPSSGSVHDNEPLMVSTGDDQSLLLSADEHSLLISIEQSNSLIIFEKPSSTSDMQGSFAQGIETSDSSNFIHQSRSASLPITGRSVPNDGCGNHNDLVISSSVGVGISQLSQGDHHSSAFSVSENSSSFFQLLQFNGMPSSSGFVGLEHASDTVYCSDRGGMNLDDRSESNLSEKQELLVAHDKLCLVTELEQLTESEDGHGNLVGVFAAEQC